MRRYWHSLYERMHDITTLITGPSGTGKELVARAIGLTRYVPFDPEREAFAGPSTARSTRSTCRRCRTGWGWLESCPAMGTVLLDEVGEIDASIQVKLLRVLQTREF